MLTITGGIEVNVESIISTDLSTKQITINTVKELKLDNILNWQLIASILYIMDRQASKLEPLFVYSNKLLKEWPELSDKKYIYVDKNKGSKTIIELFAQMCKLFAQSKEIFLKRRQFPLIPEENMHMIQWLKDVEQYYINVAKDIGSIIENFEE